MPDQPIHQGHCGRAFSRRFSRVGTDRFRSPRRCCRGSRAHRARNRRQPPTTADRRGQARQCVGVWKKPRWEESTRRSTGPSPSRRTPRRPAPRTNVIDRQRSKDYGSFRKPSRHCHGATVRTPPPGVPDFRNPDQALALLAIAHRSRNCRQPPTSADEGAGA